MQWIEFIRVRSNSITLKEAIPFLMEEIKEINASVKVKDAFIMKHALYDGDLSAVVVWKNKTKPMKTREGLLLAEKLQQLGQIDHAVWIPAKE